MKPPRIWLSPPFLSGDEMEYLKAALDSNWIAPMGPQLTAFERLLAERVGLKAAVAVNSGTAAVHLGLRALGVSAGDSVLCPALTYVASANPILYLGANPVFVDCEPDDYHLCPRWLEIAIESEIRLGRKPKALIVVQLYGLIAKMDEITALCNRYEIPILEDAAEAFGATHRGCPAGTFGRAGVLSFNGNKIITTSAGGALVSNDEELIAKTRHWSMQAKEDFPYYQHEELGYNYRMSNLLAAVGLAQMGKLDERIERRRAIFHRYKTQLNGIAGLTVPDAAPEVEPTYWLTTIQVDPQKTGGANRETVRQALEAAGIESRPVWKPLHLQPLFANRRYYGARNADALFENGLCLPSGSNLTDDEIDEIAAIIAANCQ